MQPDALGQALVQVLHVVEGLVGRAAVLLDRPLDVLARSLLDVRVCGELHEGEGRRRRAGLEAGEKGARLIEQVLALEFCNRAE